MSTEEGHDYGMFTIGFQWFFSMILTRVEMILYLEICFVIYLLLLHLFSKIGVNEYCREGTRILFADAAR